MDGTLSFVRACDCIRGMRRDLADDSVDVVVTSPPYNLGKRYSQYVDARAGEDYLAWTRDWTWEIVRVLRQNGSFFLNLGGSPANPLLPHRILLALAGEEGPFVLQNTFHWIKAVTITHEGAPLSKGHFKPINSRRFVTDCHEYVFHLTLSGAVELDRKAIGVPYQDKANIRRWRHSNGEDRRCTGNNWFIPYETIQNRAKDRPHPASFPVELPERCIRLHGNCEELTVLDPFLGSGSSWIAAKRCGVRAFYGYDIDKSYIALAKRRYRAA